MQKEITSLNIFGVIDETGFMFLKLAKSKGINIAGYHCNDISSIISTSINLQLQQFDGDNHPNVDVKNIPDHEAFVFNAGVPSSLCYLKWPNEEKLNNLFLTIMNSTLQAKKSSLKKVVYISTGLTETAQAESLNSMFNELNERNVSVSIIKVHGVKAKILNKYSPFSGASITSFSPDIVASIYLRELNVCTLRNTICV